MRQVRQVRERRGGEVREVRERRGVEVREVMKKYFHYCISEVISLAASGKISKKFPLVKYTATASYTVHLSNSHTHKRPK